MDRLNLGNLFFEVSHQQFTNLVQDMKDAAASVLRQDCTVQIAALNTPAVYARTPELQQQADERNARALLLASSSLSAVTPELWGNAGQVNVVILPENSNNRQAGILKAEFLGAKRSEVNMAADGAMRAVLDLIVRDNDFMLNRPHVRATNALKIG